MRGTAIAIAMSISAGRTMGRRGRGAQGAAAAAATAAAEAAAGRPRRCIRCNAVIADADLHKIVMYVVDERFTEHHYEHVECPGRFSV